MSESNIPKLENDYGLKFDEVEKTIEKVSLELEYLKAALYAAPNADTPREVLTAAARLMEEAQNAQVRLRKARHNLRHVILTKNNEAA